SDVYKRQVSTRANPLTDAFCLTGLKLVAQSLRRAFENGKDVLARQDMSLASLLSGLALANAGLGAVHGFAAPIGGAFRAPHGALCAALLPAVMEVNIKILRSTSPQHSALTRYQQIAEVLTGRTGESAEQGIEWVRQLGEYLRIPRLSGFGITHRDIPSLVERAAKASSMKTNPVTLSSAELEEILLKAL
ncbi:MAG: iron-containing alcohol dehydrogenase, partial [Verrucomicrobiae bacterium]|nr:iron-containing alcohol dehydrogenase [Verrucomicrobiae bacterium]